MSTVLDDDFSKLLRVVEVQMMVGILDYVDVALSALERALVHDLLPRLTKHPVSISEVKGQRNGQTAKPVVLVKGMMCLHSVVETHKDCVLGRALLQETLVKVVFIVDKFALRHRSETPLDIVLHELLHATPPAVPHNAEGRALTFPDPGETALAAVELSPTGHPPLLLFYPRRYVLIVVMVVRMSRDASW
jgi:hypothetical protein